MSAEQVRELARRLWPVTASEADEIDMPDPIEMLKRCRCDVPTDD